MWGLPASRPRWVAWIEADSHTHPVVSPGETCSRRLRHQSCQFWVSSEESSLVCLSAVCGDIFPKLSSVRMFLWGLERGRRNECEAIIKGACAYCQKEGKRTKGGGGGGEKRGRGTVVYHVTRNWAEGRARGDGGFSFSWLWVDLREPTPSPSPLRWLPQVHLLGGA